MTNEIELLFVEPQGWTHYGLPVVKVDGEEYAVAETDEIAQSAAVNAVRQGLWAFKAEFIGRFLGLNRSQQKAIAAMQDKLAEDAETIIVLMLGDRLSEFIDKAINEDGRGTFLSYYDGEEHDGEDIHPALAGRIVYRV